MDENMPQQAPQAAAPRGNEVSVGAAFSNGYKYLSENLGMYLALYFIPLVPYLILTLFVIGTRSVADNQSSADAYFSSVGGGVLAVGLVCFIAIIYLGLRAQAATIAASLAVIRGGQHPSFKQAWAMGNGHLGRVFVISLVVGILVGLGLLLLIVPGVLFAIWYFFALQAAVDKSSGLTDAMSESKRLAKGNGGVIFGFVAIYIVLAIILSFIPILGQIVSAVLGLVFSIGTTYLYVTLQGGAGGTNAPVGMPQAAPATGMPMQPTPTAPEAPKSNDQQPPVV